MITSKKNEKLKNVRKLLESSKARQEQGLFVAEGARLVSEVPPALIESLYISESYANELLPCAAALERGEDIHDGKPHQVIRELTRSLTYEAVSDDVMKSISDTVTPQGVLAVVRQPALEADFYDVSGETEKAKALESIGKEATSAKKTGGLYLLLDDVRDPGNLGTIIRTAEAAGAYKVVMSCGCADVFSPKAVRATMGSLFRVRLIKTELVPYIEELKKHNVRVLAACMEGKSMYDIGASKAGTAVIIGNEANGVSGKVALAADGAVSIPMEGRIESLNAAVSAAVLMYHFKE